MEMINTFSERRAMIPGGMDLNLFPESSISSTSGMASNICWDTRLGNEACLWWLRYLIMNLGYFGIGTTEFLDQLQIGSSACWRRWRSGIPAFPVGGFVINLV